MLLRGSITCPPCSSRSYCGAAETGGQDRAQQARPHETANESCGTMTTSARLSTFDSDIRLSTSPASPSTWRPEYSPMSSSPDISSPDALPVNVNDSESPLCRRSCSAGDVASVDRPADIARHEIALMRAGNVVARLPQVQRRASTSWLRTRCGRSIGPPDRPQADSRPRQDREASATRAACTAGPR